jgi:hypothetical protein
MRTLKGFAIFLSIMLVFIFTVLTFWVLLITQAHYAASRTLFENENARLISETAVESLVLTHNYQQPRFFFDPQKWDQTKLKPYVWNGYSISGSLSAQWSPLLENLLSLRAAKGRYASELQVPIRQLRLEDFALFSDSQQTLSSSTLFEGKVLVRNGLTLDRPSIFRDIVFNDTLPADNASFRKSYRPNWDFPLLSDLFPSGWDSGGLQITGKNPAFWQVNQYVLDLDELDISATGKNWQIKYRGISLGKVPKLILSFDDQVSVRQTYAEIPHLPSTKQEQSLVIHSLSNITLESSVQTLQGQTYSIAFCFISEKSMRISAQTSAVRISASLITLEDFFVDAGSTALPDTEKQSWNHEIDGSTFLLESLKKQELQQALNNNEKVVWCRDSVGIHGTIHVSADLIQLHFEARRKNHALIPSFPFVEIVDGRNQWL